MNQLNLGVGRDVLSYCGKCKLALAHVIVTMKISRPSKVQCKTCKAVHVYKDPTLAASSIKKTIKRTRKKSKAFAEEENSNMWTEAMSKVNSNSIGYSIKTVFNIGDVIRHPKFGNGIVETLISNDKIIVIFQAGPKTLIHNQVK